MSSKFTVIFSDPLDATHFADWVQSVVVPGTNPGYLVTKSRNLARRLAESAQPWYLSCIGDVAWYSGLDWLINQWGNERDTPEAGMVLDPVHDDELLTDALEGHPVWHEDRRRNASYHRRPGAPSRTFTKGLLDSLSLYRSGFFPNWSAFHPNRLLDNIPLRASVPPVPGTRYTSVKPPFRSHRKVRALALP